MSDDNDNDDDFFFNSSFEFDDTAVGNEIVVFNSESILKLNLPKAAKKRKHPVIRSRVNGPIQ